MISPAVVAVAITGSVPRKSDNPAVPISVSEQIESTHEAFEAGATLVHIHVRNDDETPSSDPARFAAVQVGVRRHCPDMIIRFSAGGRGRDQAARGSSLVYRPDGILVDRLGKLSDYRLREPGISGEAGQEQCRDGC